MSDSCVIADVIAVFFVQGPTRSVAAQTALLGALAADPLTEPTHGSADERKRLPFSLETLAAAAEKQPGTDIWRMRRPKYFGLVDSSPLPVSRIILRYEDISAEHIEPVCEALTRLAERLQPVYAAMQFGWPQVTAAGTASLAGISTKALAYCRYGPPGVFAWTWFGRAAWFAEDGVTVIADGRFTDWKLVPGEEVGDGAVGGAFLAQFADEIFGSV